MPHSLDISASLIHDDDYEYDASEEPVTVTVAVRKRTEKIWKYGMSMVGCPAAIQDTGFTSHVAQNITDTCMVLNKHTYNSFPFLFDIILLISHTFLSPHHPSTSSQSLRAHEQQE
jgi:hypothetical protein